MSATCSRLRGRRSFAHCPGAYAQPTRHDLSFDLRVRRCVVGSPIQSCKWTDNVGVSRADDTLSKYVASRKTASVYSVVVVAVVAVHLHLFSPFFTAIPSTEIRLTFRSSPSFAISLFPPLYVPPPPFFFFLSQEKPISGQVAGRKPTCVVPQGPNQPVKHARGA